MEKISFLRKKIRFPLNFFWFPTLFQFISHFWFLLGQNPSFLTCSRPLPQNCVKIAAVLFPNSGDTHSGDTHSGLPLRRHTQRPSPPATHTAATHTAIFGIRSAHFFYVYMVVFRYTFWTFLAFKWLVSLYL